MSSLAQRGSAEARQEVQIKAALDAKSFRDGSGAERPSDERLDRCFEFEALISDLSSRFINLRPDQVDSEIEGALRRTCELVGIDLAVLWQWSKTDRTVIAPTHVYCSPAGLQPVEPLRQDIFPWFRRQMLAGRVVALSSLAQLPAAAAVDRESCRLLGVKSNLTIPLAVGNEPVGALGLSTLLAEHDWTDSLVRRLQLVAQVFTNALARKRHDQNQQENEARLAAGTELAGLAFYEVDFGENAAYVDDRLRKLCGIPAERRQGLDALEFWKEHLHPDDRERLLDLRRKLHDGRLERLSVDYRFLHPGDGEKWIQHLAGVTRRDAGGRAVCTYGVLRDVTEHKRAENEMRDLSRRLIQAQEDERALLARELHDDVTQRLAVLAIDVGRIELAAPDSAQAKAMQTVREGLTRLSEDIHALAYQLHPSVLQELGLVEALRAECERRTRQGQLALTADLDRLPAVVTKDVALCLFRVAQEALNNVLRHAAARAASVTLRQMDDGLLLAVSDDGVGFDPEHPRERRHLGLASMRERVRLVNGTLDIESAPNQGTTIVAWVPATGEAR